MHKKQIVVIVMVIAIMSYLLTLTPKGLIKSKEAGGHTNAAAENQPTANVTVDMVSAAAKLAITPVLAAQISNLESKLKSASDGNTQLDLQKQLAKQWDDVNQAAPAAFYYKAVALKDNQFNDWLQAGNHFNDAYKLTQDTLVQPAYVKNAIECLRNATKLEPANLDAKTGLGVAYVNQTASGITDADGGSPMQGIMLLLDVVKQDPNNRSANLSLGMFAMKSGQYEKAVQRFKTVIAQKADVEPYYYLAESYKQLGMKQEAISAYQKCREMTPDSAFDRQIDNYIKELKN